MSKTVILKQIVEIPATPEAVYAAYTDPEQHAAFTGAEATGEPKVGEAFTAWGGYIEGTYLALEPNKKVVQTWSTSEWPASAEPSQLELEFAPTGEGHTKITMTHSNVPAEQADEYDAGWHASYWEPLTEYFSKS